MCVASITCVSDIASLDPSDGDDDESAVAARTELRALGFTDTAIADALSQLPPDTAAGDVCDAALEWLCVALPEHELPQQLRAKGCVV
jgi:hypothetical protein